MQIVQGDRSITVVFKVQKLRRYRQKDGVPEFLTYVLNLRRRLRFPRRARADPLRQGANLKRPVIPSHIRIFLQALQSSNPSPYTPRTAFGRPAAFHKMTVPANRLRAVAPVPRRKS
jgi:hypothetical protein